MVHPLCTPANGVPWLVWFGDQAWECRGCGARGDLGGFTTVALFARRLAVLKREHACCFGTGVPDLSAGQVGHPLNPDRAEP
jgi:hypothetical protein